MGNEIEQAFSVTALWLLLHCQVSLEAENSTQFLLAPRKQVEITFQRAQEGSREVGQLAEERRKSSLLQDHLDSPSGGSISVLKSSL